MHRKSVIEPAKIFLPKRRILRMFKRSKKSNKLIFYLHKSILNFFFGIHVKSEMPFFIRRNRKRVQQSQKVHVPQPRQSIDI
jgi:hypothetical protein